MSFQVVNIEWKKQEFSSKKLPKWEQAKSVQAKSEQAKSEQAKSEQPESKQPKSEKLKFPQITVSSRELLFSGLVPKMVCSCGSFWCFWNVFSHFSCTHQEYILKRNWVYFHVVNVLMKIQTNKNYLKWEIFSGTALLPLHHWGFHIW